MSDIISVEETDFDDYHPRQLHTGEWEIAGFATPTAQDDLAGLGLAVEVVMTSVDYLAHVSSVIEDTGPVA